MSANFDSELLRGNSTVAIAIFRIVGFEAAARGLDEKFIYTWEIDLGHFHTNPHVWSETAFFEATFQSDLRPNTDEKNWNMRFQKCPDQWRRTLVTFIQNKNNCG